MYILRIGHKKFSEFLIFLCVQELKSLFQKVSRFEDFILKYRMFLRPLLVASWNEVRQSRGSRNCGQQVYRLHSLSMSLAKNSGRG
jgi:hypothetical protein